MRIISGPSAIMKFPITGEGTNVVDGALITRGITAGTDLGVAIVSGAAGLNAVGCLLGLYTSTSAIDADPEAGTLYPQVEVEVALPGAQIAAEYALDAANDIDVASATSTVITITSLEDNIDSSWIYVSAGTGAGQLNYLVASAAGNCTIKNATGLTTLDSTSKVIKILRLFHALLYMVTDRSKLSSQAAVGTFAARVLRNQIKYAGSQGWEDLDPTKHHGLTGLQNKNVAFRSIFVLGLSFLTPID